MSYGHTNGWAFYIFFHSTAVMLIGCNVNWKTLTFSIATRTTGHCSIFHGDENGRAFWFSFFISIPEGYLQIRLNFSGCRGDDLPMADCCDDLKSETTANRNDLSIQAFRTSAKRTRLSLTKVAQRQMSWQLLILNAKDISLSYGTEVIIELWFRSWEVKVWWLRVHERVLFPQLYVKCIAH